MLIHLAQDISLAGVSLPNGSSPGLSIAQRLVVISGGALLRAPANNTEQTTDQQQLTQQRSFDLADRALLFDIRLGSTVELRSLTLRNPPLGPAAKSPDALLTLLLWTFSFSRRRLGASGVPFMRAVDVAVELQAAELALWYNKATDAVPPELQPWLCASSSLVFPAVSSGRPGCHLCARCRQQRRCLGRRAGAAALRCVLITTVCYLHLHIQPQFTTSIHRLRSAQVIDGYSLGKEHCPLFIQYRGANCVAACCA